MKRLLILLGVTALVVLTANDLGSKSAEMVPKVADPGFENVADTDLQDTSNKNDHAPLDLRGQLELVYQNVYESITLGDASTYQLFISKESKVRISNILGPLNREIDSTLLRGMKTYYKNLFDLEFVRIYETKNRAGLLYVADSDMVGLDELPRVTYSFMKFNYETDGWKLDAVSNIGSLKYEPDKKTRMEFNLSDVPYWTGEAHLPDAIDRSDTSQLGKEE
ncbi:hypothetical protein IID04_03190 [PVC group bacterium]|nr:hypothetical protein [PVC group bacterium]